MFFRAVKAGLARESKLHGTAPSIRRPISWMTLKLGICVAREWRGGGRVPLMVEPRGVVFFMCRASEISAYSNEKIHTEFTRGDVAFFKGDTQLMTPALWPCADRVAAQARP